MVSTVPDQDTPNSSSITLIARGGDRKHRQVGELAIAAMKRDSRTGCTTITSRAWSPNPFCTTDLTDTSWLENPSYGGQDAGLVGDLQMQVERRRRRR